MDSSVNFLYPNCFMQGIQMQAILKYNYGCLYCVVYNGVRSLPCP